MTRIHPIDPATATGKARTLLDAVQGKLGLVPNLMRGLAQAPAVLDGYLQFSGALSAGTLPAKTRELLALTVGQRNTCDYCLAAHSTLGKLAGLTADQVRDARLGTSVDPKTAALLRFAGQVVDERGRVSDEDFAAARAAGWDDAALTEVVGHVALNVFTNYFNHVAGTEVDFPTAPALERPASAHAH